MSTGLDRITKDPNVQSYWIYRIIAAIIDGIILYIPVWILQSIFWTWTVYGYFMMGGMFGWVLWPFVWGILWIVYSILLETSSGATIGKMVLGFKVTTLDGQKPTMNQVLIRNLSKIYGLFLLLDFALGLLTPGDPYQKYTDRIAGCRVVRAGPMQMPRSPSYAPPPTPPPSVAYCSSCGAPLPAGVAYCPRCGQKTG